ncbi:MAG TPA: hypothetical protein VNZ45_00435, partial [Bacteroidia bacterium]|nr:hypothetical protein [Bacteroidia bacterium]
MKLSILVFLFMPLFAYSQKYYPNLYLPEQDRQLAFLAYCDSMRNGFTGSMILCIDKNFQPVDSVLVGLIPYSFKGSDSVYAITKFHMRTD